MELSFMSTYLFFNIASECWGILLCITCTICALIMSVERECNKRYFIRLFLCDSVVLAADVAGLLMDGRATDYASAWNLIANTVLYIASFLLLTFFTDYLNDEVEACTGRTMYWKYGVRVICYAEMLLALLNVCVPVFFVIDAANTYQRASFFWVSQSAGILVSVVNEGLVLGAHRKLGRGKTLCLTLYNVLPIFAMLIQLLFYGISLLNITTTLLLMICFLAMMSETNRLIYDQRMTLARQETELAESRAQIMLSQIQPHFLYNALNSIYYLCGKDPKTAQKAVGDFADYLRMNLDSLKTKDNIPFAMELKHIQTYLWLEQLRFDERLNVVYDIQCRDFLLPVLTVQPIVENAVKHGICSRPEGGTVTISTRERKDHYEISVVDDGVGFVPGTKKEDGRSHIGLQNVIQRVQMEIHGEVEVESTPEVGTSITIRIPKGDQ